MSLTDEPFSIHPDENLAKELRADFRVEPCVKALMSAAAEMAAAVGVDVSWKLVNVDLEKEVDKAALAAALGRLSTAGGSILMGGHVNPISMLDANITRVKQPKSK